MGDGNAGNAGNPMPPNFSGGGCIPRVQPSELPRAAPKLHIYVTKAVIGIAATGHAPPGHGRTTQSSTRTRRHDDGDDDDVDDDGDDSPAADDPYLVCIPYIPMVISSFYEIVSVVHSETRVHHGDGLHLHFSRDLYSDVETGAGRSDAVTAASGLDAGPHPRAIRGVSTGHGHSVRRIGSFCLRLGRLAGCFRWK